MKHNVWRTGIIALACLIGAAVSGVAARTTTYAFLELPDGAYASALGGVNVTHHTRDIGTAMCNPALLSEDQHNVLSLGASSFVSSVNYGSVGYGYAIDSLNIVAGGFKFLSYGKFEERTENDEYINDFHASDYAVYLMYGRRLSDKWTAGVTLKPIFSSYYDYFSAALGVDLGVSYRHKAKELEFGVSFRNIGAQLSAYYKDGEKSHRERLPFEIVAGISKKIPHAPFRFTVTLQDLQRWKNYADHVKFHETGNVISRKKATFGDTFMRHFILGVELVPSDKFYIAVSYNHRRHREMKVFDNKTLAGLSAGLGLTIKQRVDIGATIAKYHASGMSYDFTLAVKFGKAQL